MIEVQAEYWQDLDLAIAAGLFPRNAKPKKVVLYAAIQEHNDEIAALAIEERELNEAEPAQLPAVIAVPQTVEASSTESEQQWNGDFYDRAPRPTIERSYLQRLRDFIEVGAMNNDAEAQFLLTTFDDVVSVKSFKTSKPPKAKQAIEPGTVKPVRSGSKTAILLEMLLVGASIAELKARLGWKNDPSVSSAVFRVRDFGYSWRREGDQYFLVLPEGISEPAIA
jgi:hypothetical protein